MPYDVWEAILIQCKLAMPSTFSYTVLVTMELTVYIAGQYSLHISESERVAMHVCIVCSHKSWLIPRLCHTGTHCSYCNLYVTVESTDNGS